MKQPSRKKLIEWLAQALCHVPANLCQVDPFMMPPQWVQDARAECERYGVEFVRVKDKPKKRTIRYKDKL